MTYLVNDKCIKCKLTDCVDVCPVDCFYEGKNMLVIKPDECIDCGVCEPECPIGAIEPDTNEGTEKWLEINKKYFGFDLYGLTEALQFTNYKAPGGKYDSHVDRCFGTLIRKLSVIVSLTDENKYVGGDLEFDLRNFSDKSDNIITCKEIKPQGSIVVFPSHVWHRVKPVTKGTRQSLVMWNDGKPFV